MPLDVDKLMALHEKNNSNSKEDQIKVFEEIEEGTRCNCPACMGLRFSNSKPFALFDKNN